MTTLQLTADCGVVWDPEQSWLLVITVTGIRLPVGIILVNLNRQKNG